MNEKIIFFHPYFRDGGVERTNIRVSRYLIKKGYDVEFLSLSFEGKIMEEAQQAGITLVALETERTISAIGKIRAYMTDLKKTYKVSIISCQNYANIVMWIALIGKRAGLKLIFAERNSPASLSEYGASKKDKLLLWLMKRIYRYADAITANSQESADDLSELVGAPVTCIYNPTISENYEAKATEKVADEWFLDTIPIILAVGRLDRQKDFPTLIKAFSKVKQEQECRLVIVGEGKDREELTRLVKDLDLEESVKMLGFDSNPYKYMKRATIFASSSIYEGLCNTLIEATALQIPCVATNCKSGTKEILLYGEGGYLADVGDVDGLAGGLVWALKNPEEAKQKMQKAYMALDRFTEETVGKKYLNLLGLSENKTGE